MRRLHIPESHSNHPNVTPLIDIVMCLIIFFMLVAKIGVDTGADPEIAIPASALGSEMKDPGQALTLNVYGESGDEPMVTALVDGSTLRQQIKLIDTVTNTRPLLGVLKKLKAINPDLKIIIRASEDLDYRFLEPVLITCVEAQVKNVNFNTAMGEQVSQ